MSPRYSRSEMRQDLAWAGARSADSLWADKEREDAERATACEADATAPEGYDPECRFRDHPLHTCVRRDMTLVPAGVPCWYEAQAQVAEQGAVLHSAEESIEP